MVEDTHLSELHEYVGDIDLRIKGFIYCDEVLARLDSLLVQASVVDVDLPITESADEPTLPRHDVVLDLCHMGVLRSDESSLLASLLVLPHELIRAQQT